MILPFLHSRFEFDDIEPLENKTYLFSIHQVRPKNKDFQLLITNGMANYHQPVTQFSAAYQQIELFFCLPDYWDLQKNNWPLHWLNLLGEIPQKNKTWFGPGDTIPAGRPPQAIDKKLSCEYFILSPPIGLAEELSGCTDIKLLAVIPIFKRELDYKMQNSGTLLLQKLAEKRVSEMVDIFREPVARKKFMGLF